MKEHLNMNVATLIPTVILARLAQARENSMTILENLRTAKNATDLTEAQAVSHFLATILILTLIYVSRVVELD